MKPERKNKPTAQSSTPKKISKIDTGNAGNKTYFIAGAILLITLFCYLGSLHNEFLKTWDDQAYVTNNPLVKDVSFKGIKRMFREDAGQYANYHPLTILSLALNYHEGVASFPYHLTSLLFHLGNTLLVFIFIFLLSGKKIIVAALTSLWFGIHPMHVESVAWISERKDVLYTFFYLLALISYIYYLAGLRKAASSPKPQPYNPLLFYSLTLIFFFLSSLSKAMAVSLPLVLLLTDYFTKRKFTAKILLEKLPFVAISIVLGIYALKVQAAGGATQGTITFPFFNKVLHSFYGFTEYIVKLFVPIRLSAFYPYPYQLVNSAWIVSSIPGVFYATLLVGIIILATAIRFGLSTATNKEIPQSNSYLKRSFVFGVGFYLATIALVLQFFPVGRTIMSDRYAYIPYIGLFFLIGQFIHHYVAPPPPKGGINSLGVGKLGRLLMFVVGVYTIIFFILTVKQTKVWKNDDTLWSATIANYPDDNKIVLAYNNRAAYYFMEKRYDESLNDYLTIVRHDPKDVVTLEKIGRIYGQNKNDLDDAIQYFEKAVAVEPKTVDALRGLATAYGMKAQYNKSLDNALKALEIVPDDSSLYVNAATSYYFLGNQQKFAEYKAKAEHSGKK